MGIIRGFTALADIAFIYIQYLKAGNATDFYKLPAYFHAFQLFRN